MLPLLFLLPFPATYAQEAGPLVISEFMAANDQTLADSRGEFADWIEIWNPSGEPVRLQGWHLTDAEDEPTQWALPDIELGPDSYLIIFASGENRRDPSAELHANFRLDRDGEYLALTRMAADGPEVASAFTPYPGQYTDYSYGLLDSPPSQATGYLKNPTPGASNDVESEARFVADTRFSVDRGYYTEPFEVEVTTDTPGATLVYTMDGSPPRPFNGTEVAPPDNQTPPTLTLAIDETTSLRVMAIKSGYESSNIDTQTYIFPNQALHQSGQGDPNSEAVHWGHAGPDWEMDPDILNHPNPDVRPVSDDFLRIPTVSLVTEFNLLFGEEGIYIAGEDEEIDASMELLNPDALTSNPNGADGLQGRGTVQIVGGTSPNRWKTDKLSMRFKFEPDLEYPVFGQEAAERFDTLVIDARLNNVWHYGGGVEPEGQRGRAQYVRDQYAANLHNAMGGTSPHGQHVHVYLNGIYWGIHTLHERPDDNFAASYFAGKNEHYDSIKHNPNDVLQGSSANYRTLHELADRNLQDNSNYEAVKQRLDIDDFIRYMLVNYYLGNQDWAHHNWYASYNRVAPDGRWRFHSWDAEKGIHHVHDNVTGRNDGGAPTNLHHDLVANPEYRLRFADLAYHHLRHGILTPETASGMYREITDDIDLSMRLESARWGDNQKSNPFTRLDWLNTRREILGERADQNGPRYNYFNRRSEIVLEQFRDRGWLPSIEPPSFNAHGGRVDQGFQLEIEAGSQGTIYYTLDGTDPRLPSQGGTLTETELIAEDASKRVIIPLGVNLQQEWHRRDFDDSNWLQGTQGAGYDNNTDYDPLIDPDLDIQSSVSPDRNETLYMRIPFTVEDPSAFDSLVMQIRYDDGFVAYLNGVEIARANAPGEPGEPAPWNSSASSNHSDNSAVKFQSVDVSNALDLIEPGANLLAIHGLNVNPSSSDFLIWPKLVGIQREGGTDSSISPSAQEYTMPIPLNTSTQVKARVHDGQEWSALTRARFVVGAVSPTAQNLVLSRIHYHPAPASPTESASGFTHRDFEFLELINIGDQALDLREVRFTDGIDYVFDDQAAILELAPNAKLLLVSNAEAFRGRFDPNAPLAGEFRNDTNLANGGERIAIADAEGTTLLEVSYGDTAPWPEEADGNGYSLALRDPQTHPDTNDPTNWTAQPEAGANGNDSSLEQWRNTHFSSTELEDPAISGLDADPDGDRIPNIFEYFHASDPQAPQPEGSHLNIRLTEIHDSPRVEIRFLKRRDIPGLTWALTQSPNLVQWQDVPTAEATFTSGPSEETEEVRFTLDPSTETAYFRLTVSQTDTD